MVNEQTPQRGILMNFRRNRSPKQNASPMPSREAYFVSRLISHLGGFDENISGTNYTEDNVTFTFHGVRFEEGRDYATGREVYASGYLSVQRGDKRAERWFQRVGVRTMSGAEAIGYLMVDTADALS